MNIDNLTDRDIYHLAGLAFDLLYKHSIAPSPRAYAVWFSYADGENPRIVRAINGLLKAGRSIDRLEIERLHDEFIENRFVPDAQMNISLELASSISNINELVENSMLQSQNFEQMLNHTQMELTDISSPDSLRRVTEKLITENEQMLASNAALGNGLQVSREHISALNCRIEELEAISMQDPLTGIYNRRAFDARLGDEIGAASSTSTFYLTIVDIDHFKRINDILGHQTGDSVLVSIASLLNQFAKNEGALVARYGGEEFVILMSDMDIVAAHNKLVNLKGQIGKMKCLPAADHERIGSISASFGQSRYLPGRMAAELFEIADQKLYEAKRSGRNAIRSEGLNM